MEALLEREADVERWNDDRLDELSRRMDAGFKEMKEGFVQVGDRIDRLTNTLIIGGAGFCAAIVAAAVFG
jgi:hypothetical protein